MLTGQIGLRRFGTSMVSRGIEWATDSHTHHVVVAISEGVCVSAEPGGVRLRRIDDYPHVDWSRFDLADAQRDVIVATALDYAARQVKYNLAIYPPLLFQKLTGHKVDGWVAEWLSKRPNENCSQLSGDIYTKAGIHLFEDIAELVTPGDFERLFVRLGFPLAPQPKAYPHAA